MMSLKFFNLPVGIFVFGIMKIEDIHYEDRGYSVMMYEDLSYDYEECEYFGMGMDTSDDYLIACFMCIYFLHSIRTKRLPFTF